jgi:hypothetical protein
MFGGEERTTCGRGKYRERSNLLANRTGRWARLYHEERRTPWLRHDAQTQEGLLGVLFALAVTS